MNKGMYGIARKKYTQNKYPLNGTLANNTVLAKYQKGNQIVLDKVFRSYPKDITSLSTIPLDNTLYYDIKYWYDDIYIGLSSSSLYVLRKETNGVFTKLTQFSVGSNLDVKIVDNTTVLCVYTSGEYSFLKLFQYINNTYTLSSAVNVDASRNNYYPQLAKLSSNRFVVVYTTNSSSASAAWGVVVTVSNSTISVGSAQNSLNSYSIYPNTCRLVTLDTDKIGGVFSNGTVYYGFVFTVSGNTITSQYLSATSYSGTASPYIEVLDTSHFAILLPQVIALVTVSSGLTYTYNGHSFQKISGLVYYDNKLYVAGSIATYYEPYIQAYSYNGNALGSYVDIRWDNRTDGSSYSTMYVFRDNTRILVMLNRNTSVISDRYMIEIQGTNITNIFPIGWTPVRVSFLPSDDYNVYIAALRVYGVCIYHLDIVTQKLTFVKLIQGVAYDFDFIFINAITCIVALRLATTIKLYVIRVKDTQYLGEDTPVTITGQDNTTTIATYVKLLRWQDRAILMYYNTSYWYARQLYYQNTLQMYNAVGLSGWNSYAFTYPLDVEYTGSAIKIYAYSSLSSVFELGTLTPQTNGSITFVRTTYGPMRSLYEDLRLQILLSLGTSSPYISVDMRYKNTSGSSTYTQALLTYTGSITPRYELLRVYNEPYTSHYIGVIVESSLLFMVYVNKDNFMYSRLFINSFSGSSIVNYTMVGELLLLSTSNALQYGFLPIKKPFAIVQDNSYVEITDLSEVYVHPTTSQLTTPANGIKIL